MYYWKLFLKRDLDLRTNKTLLLLAGVPHVKLANKHLAENNA